MNLMAKIRDGSLNAEIPLVIASRANCGGVGRSAELGLRCEVIERKLYYSVDDFSQPIIRLCREVKADVIICGGFLSMVAIPEDYSGRVINIHPSLIPAFCGKGFHGHHVHEAVLQRGAKISGCTVHFVDEQYDHGPIILQKPVPVLDADTADDLAARVFAAECEALPEAIRLFASAQLEIDGSRVRTINR